MTSCVLYATFWEVCFEFYEFVIEMAMVIAALRWRNDYFAVSLETIHSCAHNSLKVLPAAINISCLHRAPRLYMPVVRLMLCVCNEGSMWP